MIAKFLSSDIVSQDNGIKVHIFPEDRKSTTKCPHFVLTYLNSWLKKVWRFSHIFVALPEYSNFKGLKLTISVFQD